MRGLSAHQGMEVQLERQLCFPHTQEGYGNLLRNGSPVQNLIRTNGERAIARLTSG